VRLEFYKRLLKHDRDFILTQNRWAEECPDLFRAYLKYYTDKLPLNKEGLGHYIHRCVRTIANEELHFLAPEYKQKELFLQQRRCEEQRRKQLAAMKRGGMGMGALGALGGLGRHLGGLGLTQLDGVGWGVSVCAHVRMYICGHARGFCFLLSGAGDEKRGRKRVYVCHLRLLLSRVSVS
jgi:hypothetical protein